MPTIPPLAAYGLALALMFLPGRAAAQTRPAAPIMELPALLELFLLPADAAPDAVLPWDAATGSGSRVRWAFAGTLQALPHQRQQGFTLQRVGHVAISIDGQPAYEVVQQQRRLPGAWRVTLLGAREGVVHVDIHSEANTEEMEMDVPRLLERAGWTVTRFRCSREASPATFGRVVHVVEAPGRRVAWLQESWDYGALNGLLTALTVLHRFDDADTVECVTR